MAAADGNPYLGFRFHVEFDGIIEGGFSSVTNLEQQMEPEEYEEGGNNRYTHKLPTRFAQSNVELQRGVTDSRFLWDWVGKLREGATWTRDSRKTIGVYLLNAVGERSWGWEFTYAYPVRWAGPEFQADQGAVAVETLELAYEEFNEIDVGQSGGPPRS